MITTYFILYKIFNIPGRAIFLHFYSQPMKMLHQGNCSLLNVNVKVALICKILSNFSINFKISTFVYANACFTKKT